MSIDDISRDESMARLRGLFAKRGGEALEREELLQAMRRAYGLGALGRHIRQELSGDIRVAVRRGILDIQGGRFRLLCRNIGEYAPSFLREMLLAGMGAGWWERGELIQQTARYLGFRRTGPAIQKALKSAINSAVRRGELERAGQRLRRAKR